MKQLKRCFSFLHLGKLQLDDFIKKKPIGKVIVVSAPSGTGKTTICKHLLRTTPNLVFSVSYTTRKRRPGEVQGKDYYFVDKDIFLKMISENKLIEWAKVYNNYYGTPKEFLEKTINSGKDILLDIDVQGAKNIKKIYPDGIYIFLLPPSEKVLRERLINRKKDLPQDIETRLKNVKKELKYIKYYDYVVVNDKLSETLKVIKSIIIAEKHKIKNCSALLSGRDRF